MKKLFRVLAVAAVAASPLIASAASVAAGQQYSLPAQQAVIGNLYVAAGTATIGGRVTGDVYAVGGTITVAGSVGGDIAAGAGTVQILGPVDGDVRVAGGTVTISDRVDGDLVVFGGTVHVLPGAAVRGDVLATGGSIIIDGTVTGSVKLAAGSLFINGAVSGTIDAKLAEAMQIGPTARIAGNVTYKAPAQAVIADGAVMSGTVSYVPTRDTTLSGRIPQRAFWAFASLLTGVQMLAVLGLTALLTWRWRRQALGLLSEARDSFWPSLGRGFAYIVLAPLAAILLLVSIVGMLPGILVLVGLTGAMVITKALAGMFLGSWLVMLARKREVMQVTWATALGGVVLFEVIGMIPVIGWLFTGAIWVMVFGALAYRIQTAVLRS